MSESTIGQATIRNDLTSIERDMLFAIAHCDGWPDVPRRYRPSGADVARQLKQAHSDPVSHGSNYTALSTLIEKGLAEKDILDGRTDGYRLTEAGLAVCETHIEWMVNGLEGQS
jgi:PadR family transcriptional regulator PadR